MGTPARGGSELADTLRELLTCGADAPGDLTLMMAEMEAGLQKH